jgi:hypothetical protein
MMSRAVRKTASGIRRQSIEATQCGHGGHGHGGRGAKPDLVGKLRGDLDGQAAGDHWQRGGRCQNETEF